MPKDPHISGGIRHDWAAIKHYYVTDPDATLRKAAKKYGVSNDSIFKKSKAEGWFATRKKHQEKVIAKGIAKTGELQAKELSQTSDFLALMSGHMSRMLSDSQQFQRQLIMNPMTGNTEERVTEKFDARALKDSMQALEMIEKMTRSLYNLQKAETIQKHQLDAERLQLERERFEFEKQKAEMFKPTDGNAIRIEGFEEEWSK